MNILVCIKQVPESNHVTTDPTTGVLKRDGVDSKLNPYDLYAIELALTLRERFGGKVQTLTMGPAQAKEAVLESLYMGVDEGWVVSDPAFAGSDVLATSYALSQAVKKTGAADLILCGRQTTDGDTAQVGVELAEWLGLLHTTHVTSVETADRGSITVRTSTEDHVRTEKLLLPCLLCTGDRINTPRLPSYRRKQKLEEGSLHWLTLADLADPDPGHYGLEASPTQVVRIFQPEKKKEKKIIKGTAGEVADTLYRLLEKEKLIQEADTWQRS